MSYIIDIRHWEHYIESDQMFLVVDVAAGSESRLVVSTYLMCKSKTWLICQRFLSYISLQLLLCILYDNGKYGAICVRAYQ